MKIVETKKNPAVLIHMVRISEHWYKLEKIIITLATTARFGLSISRRVLYSVKSRVNVYI